jgi:hypothetical protein
MNIRQARQILRSYRPSGEDDNERDVREALKFAAKNPALDAEFQSQLAFDRALATQLEALPLPVGVDAALEDVALRLEARRVRRFSFRDPAMLAVGLAFLFLVALIAWMFVGQGSFAGMQEVSEMVVAGDGAGPDQFSEIETNASALTDWFVMKDFDGFTVAKGLEAAPVVGVRLFKYEEVPVAVAAVAKPKALIYVLAAQPLGISLPEGQWRTATYGPKRNRAFAIQQIGPMAFILTLREGGEAELKQYLATLPGR